MRDTEMIRGGGGTDELRLRRDSPYRLAMAAQQGLLPCPPDLAMEFLRQQLKNPRGVFLVAMEPHKIAGCASKVIFSVGGKRRGRALMTQAMDILPDYPWLYLQKAPAD